MLVCAATFGCAADGLAKSVARGLRRVVLGALLGEQPGRRAVEADLAFGTSGSLFDVAVYDVDELPKFR